MKKKTLDIDWSIISKSPVAVEEKTGRLYAEFYIDDIEEVMRRLFYKYLPKVIAEWKN